MASIFPGLNVLDNSQVSQVEPHEAPQSQDYTVG